MAESEFRLRYFKAQCGEEAQLVARERECMGDSHQALTQNSLAMQLLPQARVVVAMRGAREAVLSQTALGYLFEAIDTEVHVASGNAERSNEPLFRTDFDNTAWAGFKSALDSGDKVQMLTELRILLNAAISDIISTDLPPVAPGYQLPGK